MKQNKSARKRIVDTTKEYSSSTTIHGMAYLFGDHISGVERLLWAVVVFLALYFAAYQVSNLYNEWQENPVATTLETVALPIEEIEFPAVTICPQGSRQEIIDLVLLRQLTEHIKKSVENLTTLTDKELARDFLDKVYPGARESPTLLAKLIASDDPKIAFENEAVLNLEEECDNSSNSNIVDAVNKQLKNDTCPKGFEMAQGSNYCIHATITKMTYNNASQYCNGLSGSSLFHLNNYEELGPSSQFLQYSGNVNPYDGDQ